MAEESEPGGPTLDEFLLTLSTAELVAMADEAITARDESLQAMIREILKRRKPSSTN